MNAQEKPTGIVDRTRLMQSLISWPRSLKSLKPAKRERFGPRAHQKRAIADVVEGFESHERGQLIMACGTGKTLTALWIAEALQAERTLVLVPSLSLLRQTLVEWSAQTCGPFAFKAVCSDESVKPSDDEMVSSVMDIGESVTTNHEEIAFFLRRKGRRVVFATYQSSPAIAAAQAFSTVPSFDLAVCDEAHRTAGAGDGAFSTVLDAVKIRARRRLFMTATPRYFTDAVKKEAGEVGLQVTSMDDEVVYGPRMHSLSFGRAVEDDLLCDYRVLITAIDHPTYKALIEKAALVRGKGLSITDARTLGRELTLLRAMRKYNLRRVLSFHSRVKGAQQFSNELTEVRDWAPPHCRPRGKLWASHVSGAMPAGQRQVSLERLRNVHDGESGVLANARCLGEGVDIPAIDGVAFIDPRQSQTDIVQAVGRAMRKAEGKTLGTIVIPVVIDPDEDAETVLSSSQFRHVWHVVRALRAHDEVLADELDAARRALGRQRTTLEKVGKIVVDFAGEIDESFARAVDVKLVEASTSIWETWFGTLEDFVATNGHAQVPVVYLEGEFRLGQWVSVQRSTYSGGKLSKERVARLEALPGWVWAPFDSLWDASFAALAVFAEREGHARVPNDHSESGLRLGTWVGKRRSAYKAGKLSEERIARLEALPGWEWNANDYDAQWDANFAALGAFVKRKGHALVPAVHSESGLRLGGWVVKQRSSYSGDNLSEERIARLEALPGWTWAALDSTWDANFAALEVFVKRERHARVPRDHLESEIRLGGWVVKQRSSYGRGKLTEERVARLETLPAWTWVPFDSLWDASFAALAVFAEREGNTRVPNGHLESGIRLGHWVGRQRSACSAGKLSNEHIAPLEALPGWTWTPHDSPWDANFAALEVFAKREGHALVPVGHSEGGLRLGMWVNTQRSAYKAGKLSEERIARLETLTGWGWDARDYDERWNTNFAALEAFVEREGSARVPHGHSEGGLRLGQWVGKQRSKCSEGKLSEERVARLEALPGWEWRARDERWDATFAALAAFVKRKGHARVPAVHLEGEFRLGQWVSVQRATYRGGKLSKERIARLEALPGWVWRVKNDD